MTTPNRENSFDSTNLLLFIYKWRKTLLIIGALAIVSSVIIAKIIPDKFKSTVVLYPTTTSSISKALLSENPGSKQDILEFGAEEQSEQMIQVLNSDDIMNTIFKKWKLAAHYRIDTTKRTFKTDLIQTYQGNVNIKRTEFLSVQIEVLDEDPFYARDIANDIADLYDSTKQRIRKERAMQGLKIVEQTYRKLDAEVTEMQDSLNQLMKLGVNDYESQSDRLNEALSRAILDGKTAAAKELREQLKVLSTYGEAYMSLRDNLEVRRKSLNEIKTKYEEAKVDAEANLSDKFVVNHAVASEKKAYPIRWLIVVVSLLASQLLGILLIIVLENIGRVRKEIK
jgi:uncharacterized protein involved in exopolysaccharide biosynthesis